MLGKLWAVARVTIAQGIRMKVALVIVFFLLAVVPALPFLLRTDGTQLGQVRIVVTYSLYLAMFLLSILTLLVSTTSISKEIEQKQIFVLDPKPLGRWQIFVGKWIGIMTLNAILIALLGIAAYILMMALSRPGDNEKEFEDLRNNFLISRENVTPDLPQDLGRLVDAEYESRREQQLLPEDRAEIWVKQKLVPIVARRLNSVEPLTYKMWTFSGLPTNLPPDTKIQFRFMHNVTSRNQPDDGILGQWQLGDPNGVNYEFKQVSPYDGYHTVEVPADAIAPDGTMAAAYTNLRASQPLVIFPFEDGIRISYPVGSLEANYLKALLVIFLMLGMLALVGLVCGALLSFPVAILVVLAVFCIGVGAVFLSAQIQGTYFFGPELRQPGAAFNVGDQILQGVLQFVLFLFPPLLEYSPVSMVSDAQSISWVFVLKTLVELLLFRGGVVAVIGAFLFHRRELGTASVQ